MKRRTTTNSRALAQAKKLLSAHAAQEKRRGIDWVLKNSGPLVTRLAFNAAFEKATLKKPVPKAKLQSIFLGALESARLMKTMEGANGPELTKRTMQLRGFGKKGLDANMAELVEIFGSTENFTRFSEEYFYASIHLAAHFRNKMRQKKK